ncbi:MAG: hypothetical protein HYV95_14265 [Opitutae bacterium]|nr:hypothetical protein [Opitutae bacterium]
MKNPTPVPRWWLPAGLLAAAAVTLEAGLLAGGFAYTKRVETTLLAEPRPLAASVGKLGYGRKVKIDDTQGAWLHVSDEQAAGWVFAGNLAEAKPAEGKGADALGLKASETSATAAARPLTPDAEAYAQRRNLTNARDDLAWLLAEAQKVTPDDVEQFLQAQKKGEYR